MYLEMIEQFKKLTAEQLVEIEEYTPEEAADLVVKYDEYLQKAFDSGFYSPAMVAVSIGMKHKANASPGL